MSLQLAKMGVQVQGVLLIDSPSPIKHVPLSDSVIDSVLNLQAHNAGSELRRSVKAQFTMNASMLGKYDARAASGRCPTLVLLRSSEGYYPSGVSDVPRWLADRHDASLASGPWEIIAGEPIKVIDIPGHHFQPFEPSNVRHLPLSLPSMILICFQLRSRKFRFALPMDVNI
jgi:hypothetical protein